MKVHYFPNPIKEPGRVIYLCGLICVCIALTACTPNLYYASSTYTPAIHHQGELEVNGQVLSITNLWAGAQAAYSPINHIGIMAAYSRDQDKVTCDTIPAYRYHQVFEAGIGYYNLFKPLQTFYLYGGYGRGMARINDYQEAPFSFYDIAEHYYGSLQYHKFFVQPAYSFADGNVGVICMMRFTFLNFNKYDIHMDNVSPYSVSATSELDLPSPNVFVVETALRVFAGGRYLRFIADAGVCNVINGQQLPDIFNPIFMNAGIQFHLGK